VSLQSANSDTLYGGAGSDTLQGGIEADVLDGGVGADNMAGGMGSDTYIVDNIGDTVIEFSDEGSNDTVQSSVSHTLSANVEKLTLTGTAAINATGNALANILTGNSGDNILDGGAGADTMVGGTGNDIYIVDNVADVVTESGVGVDLVLSSVSFTLGSNIENLTLTGTDAINATGNTLANVLTGNNADNVLNGGTGADTMIGGAGNDTYVVDNASDIVTEFAGEGVDTVQSSVTYALATNVENLTLTGSGAINGTGNTLDNVLIGNSAANTLAGGGGNDTYRFAAGSGSDIVTDTGGNDMIAFADLDPTSLWFSQSGNNLVISRLGSTDSVTISNWFGSTDAQIETITASNGSELLHAGEVNSLISQMAAFAAQVGSNPAAVQPGDLPPEYQVAVSAVWHSA
jgi:Ca2+-binding RTX toxin-like protein